MLKLLFIVQIFFVAGCAVNFGDYSDFDSGVDKLKITRKMDQAYWPSIDYFSKVAQVKCQSKGYFLAVPMQKIKRKCNKTTRAQVDNKSMAFGDYCLEFEDSITFKCEK